MVGDAERRSEREQVGHVARAVVEYLRKHPNAMDSFEGIARFWILRQRIEAELEVLEKAVTALVEARVLEVVQVESLQFFRLPACRTS